MPNQLLIQATPTEKLTHRAAVGKEPIRVVYRGSTTSTTKTEIFINGISGYRFQPPANSVGYFTKTAICYNNTDDAAGTGTPEVSTGNFTRLGTDGVNMSVTEAATHIAVDIEADDTNDYITVSVTGADATDDLRWEVNVDYYIISVQEADNPTGIYDGVQK